MSTSNSHNDDEAVRLLREMDKLAVRIDRGQATPEEEGEYDALRDAVDCLLGIARKDVAA